MSGKDIKLALNPGVELKPTSIDGIHHAKAIDADERFGITWDRFSRLFRTAEAIKERVDSSCRILDVGGFDGALALFLAEYQIDVIDPITTGGTGIGITMESYDVVVSIDALEHVHPGEREIFLEHLCNAARQYVFINFPGLHTATAQKLIYDLTNNPLVKEHVIWQLPEMNQVKELMEGFGFRVETICHTSLSQWVSQYMLQTVAPDAAAKVNRHLLEHHLEEPVGMSLYDLLIGRTI